MNRSALTVHGGGGLARPEVFASGTRSSLYSQPGSSRCRAQRSGLACRTKPGSGPDTHTLPGRSACSLDQSSDGKLADQAVSAGRPINNSRVGSSGSWAGTPPSLRPRARTLIGANLGAQPRRTRAARRHGGATVSGAFEARCLTPLGLRPSGPGPASRLVSRPPGDYPGWGEDSRPSRSAVGGMSRGDDGQLGGPSGNLPLARQRHETKSRGVSSSRCSDSSRGTDREFQAWRRRPQNGPGAGAVTR